MEESEPKLRPAVPADLIDPELETSRALRADRFHVKLRNELSAIRKLRE